MLAFDCISEGDSIKICEEAISSSKGGVITCLLRSALGNITRSDITGKHTSGYTVIGEAFDKLGAHVEAKPDDFEHAKKFWSLTQSLVEDGQLKPHPVEVGKDGLVGVFAGLQQGREGKISGKKLVYRVADTP